MKEKHVWSAQVLDLLMSEPSDAYMGSGSEPYRMSPMGESDGNAELLQLQFMALHSQKMEKKNEGNLYRYHL